MFRNEYKPPNTLWIEKIHYNAADISEEEEDIQIENN